MTKKITVKEALDSLNTKYGKTLEMLNDALDVIDNLERTNQALKDINQVLQDDLAIEPKTIIKEIEVEIEKVVTVEKEVIVPKETVVTREVEVPGPERIVEVPGPERRVEVPGPERIVEVEKIVEVKVPGPERRIEVPVEKIVQVPGPERIVTKEVPGPEVIITKEVPGPERVVKVEVPGPERIVEKIVKIPGEKPEVIEKAPTKDLREASRIMAMSEFNKEGYSEEEIFSMLEKTSEEDVNKQLGGFWAIPLPVDNDSNDNITTRYTKK
jgi:hypothetical protein